MDSLTFLFLKKSHSERVNNLDTKQKQSALQKHIRSDHISLSLRSQNKPVPVWKRYGTLLRATMKKISNALSLLGRFKNFYSVRKLFQSESAAWRFNEAHKLGSLQPFIPSNEFHAQVCTRAHACVFYFWVLGVWYEQRPLMRDAPVAAGFHRVKNY